MSDIVLTSRDTKVKKLSRGLLAVQETDREKATVGELQWEHRREPLVLQVKV